MPEPVPHTGRTVDQLQVRARPALVPLDRATKPGARSRSRPQIPLQCREHATRPVACPRRSGGGHRPGQRRERHAAERDHQSTHRDHPRTAVPVARKFLRPSDVVERAEPGPARTRTCVSTAVISSLPSTRHRDLTGVRAVGDAHVVPRRVGDGRRRATRHDLAPLVVDPQPVRVVHHEDPVVRVDRVVRGHVRVVELRVRLVPEHDDHVTVGDLDRVCRAGPSRRRWTFDSSGPLSSTAYSNGRLGPGRASPASARIASLPRNCHLAGRHGRPRAGTRAGDRGVAGPAAREPLACRSPSRSCRWPWRSGTAHPARPGRTAGRPACRRRAA